MRHSLRHEPTRQFTHDELVGLSSYATAYARMMFRPVSFFEKTNFSGDAGVSLRAIVFFSLASGVVSMWYWGSAHPLLLITFPVMSLFLAVTVSSILDSMRKIFGIKADYNQFLRFFAYYYLMTFPLTALSLGNYRLACALNLFAVLWSILGFSIAFRPSAKPFFAFAGAIAIIFSISTAGTFTAYDSSISATSVVKDVISKVEAALPR